MPEIFSGIGVWANREERKTRGRVSTGWAGIDKETVKGIAEGTGAALIGCTHMRAIAKGMRKGGEGECRGIAL